MKVVAGLGLEPRTPALSRRCSNQAELAGKNGKMGKWLLDQGSNLGHQH